MWSILVNTGVMRVRGKKGSECLLWRLSCMRVYLAPGHMYDLVCVVRRYDTDHDTELLFTLPTQLRSAHSSIFVFVYKAMTWPANYQWTSRHYLIWRQSKFMQSAYFYHPWPVSGYTSLSYIDTLGLNILYNRRWHK